MQTILGAGGPVGIALAKELPTFTKDIRLVSRNPEKVNPKDQLFKANLLNSEEVFKAVEGSEVVYLTVGLNYNYKLWQKDWPVIMDNVIQACQKWDSRLVFFDNVYLYDKEEISHMSEDSKINPPSKKGMVRREIAKRLMQQVKSGQLKALIARSADFYGPDCQGNSLLIETVFKPLSQGKKANWLGTVDAPHSFTYVPDAAKATVLLGNSKTAYGQVWHLPTAANPPSGREWVEMVAREMGVNAKFREVPKWMVRLMGIFMPVMRETVEMFYQYDRKYVFDSNKFEASFEIRPTAYREAIHQIICKQFS